jgi:hypothetical protein
MASEALVDLSYRGLVLGKRVRLLQVGPRSAYVAHEAPMPVGTELTLTVDESLAIPVQVARVREGDPREGAAGMWLWADAAEARARAWWDEHVTADDPRIPEPGGGRIRTEAPVVPASAPELPAPVADVVAPVSAAPAEPEQVAAMAPATEHVHDAGEDDDHEIEIRRAASQAEPYHEDAEAGAADETDAVDEAAPADRGNHSGRHARGTQVMTAVEISDVLGMEPVEEGEAAGDADASVESAREVRTTHVMTAVEVAEVLASGGDEPAPRDDAAARGKARGKRRNRKRR